MGLGLADMFVVRKEALSAGSFIRRGPEVPRSREVLSSCRSEGLVGVGDVVRSAGFPRIG